MRTRKVPLKTVLLVSGDRRLKRQVHACLPATGLPTAVVTENHNDTERLRTSLRTTPHVVVLDDSASPQAGLTMLETLRQYSPHALIVYVACLHTAELERAVRQHGVLYYTEKPPDAAALQRVLASALRRSVGAGKFAA